MELVVDPHGRPAPRLVDAHVARDMAGALYADLRRQAVGRLARTSRRSARASMQRPPRAIARGLSGAVTRIGRGRMMRRAVHAPSRRVAPVRGAPTSRAGSKPYGFRARGRSRRPAAARSEGSASSVLERLGIGDTIVEVSDPEPESADAATVREASPDREPRS